MTTVFATLLLLAAPSASAPPSQSAALVQAARAFLDSLDDVQRKRAVYAFDDEKQRANWSNFPTGFVPRGGVSLRELSPGQRAAAMSLLAAALSPQGLTKVKWIMEGDEVNKATDQGPPGGPPGGHPPRRGGAGGPPENGAPPGRQPGTGGPPPRLSADMFGRDLYYFSFLGEPSSGKPWMLQFGGHHLALNLTVDGEKGTLTPSLTGAQPARFTLEGKTVRPLGAESDKGLALLRALEPSQRKKAILGYQLADLVLGPGQDGKTIAPEGLRGAEMSERQRALMLELIREWVDIVHADAAAPRMAQLGAELDDTWFAWSGPTEVKEGDNIAAYYRVQGPHLIIEYAPQELGGDPSNHVHTMYRDPTHDYGRKPSAR